MLKEKYKQLCLHGQFRGVCVIVYTHTLGASIKQSKFR